MSANYAPELPAVLGETQLSTHAAAKMMRTTRRTVVRWLSDGFKVGGRTVRLEGVMAGSRWTTSREAVARFLLALDQARKPPAPVTSPTIQRRQSQKLDEELRRLGVRI